MTARPQDNEPSLIGTVIGQYRITALLGRGGMGAVYRARHEIIGREAAIKLLRPELTANPELVQRFFNEARAATAIRHPGIIEVFDFGYFEDGRAYLVMEYLEGVSLTARIAAQGRLTEVEAGMIARGIASALTAAHAKGIIHRDLKPDNVFLVADPDYPSGERPKVLDFGIAKLADSAPGDVRQTRTGALMGTPLYMAPEQARAAGEIDHRADLYSLGCILYEMLVGQPPFVAVGAGEIIAMQMFSDPVPPSARLVEISPEMEAIVMKLLRKEPNERFQRAIEVTEALGAIVGRLSARLSAPLAAAPSAQMPMVRARPTPMPTGPQGGAANATMTGMPVLSEAALRDERPSMQEKRSAMPIIAAVLTFAIAGGAAAFVLTRSHGGDPDAPPAAGSAGATATATETANTPTTPTNVAPLAPTIATRPTLPTTSPDPRDAKDARDAKGHKHGGGSSGANGAAAVTTPDTGPVVSPDGMGGAAITRPSAVTPNGPQTNNGTPIETSLDKPASAPVVSPPAPVPEAKPPEPKPAPDPKPPEPKPAVDPKPAEPAPAPPKDS